MAHSVATVPQRVCKSTHTTGLFVCFNPISKTKNPGVGDEEGRIGSLGLAGTSYYIFIYIYIYIYRMDKHQGPTV